MPLDFNVAEIAGSWRPGTQHLSLHWSVDGISCWPELEQQILTTSKSLQGQTPPKPTRQIWLVCQPSVAGQHYILTLSSILRSFQPPRLELRRLQKLFAGVRSTHALFSQIAWRVEAQIWGSRNGMVLYGSGWNGIWYSTCGSMWSCSQTATRWLPAGKMALDLLKQTHQAGAHRTTNLAGWASWHRRKTRCVHAILTPNATPAEPHIIIF